MRREIRTGDIGVQYCGDARLGDIQAAAELSSSVPPESTVYGATPPLPGLTGGVKPAGMVKFTGELDVRQKRMRDLPGAGVDRAAQVAVHGLGVADREQNLRMRGQRNGHRHLRDRQRRGWRRPPSTLDDQQLSAVYSADD